MIKTIREIPLHDTTSGIANLDRATRQRARMELDFILIFFWGVGVGMIATTAIFFLALL